MTSLQDFLSTPLSASLIIFLLDLIFYHEGPEFSLGFVSDVFGHHETFSPSFKVLFYIRNCLLARPSLRGACPLDVAYSSLMDNNELALALRESDLDKVAVYLSRCGQQTNTELLTKGYPDIGWDPVEGERFLDFLRFCVWVNGTSYPVNI